MLHSPLSLTATYLAVRLDVLVAFARLPNKNITSHTRIIAYSYSFVKALSLPMHETEGLDEDELDEFITDNTSSNMTNDELEDLERSVSD